MKLLDEKTANRHKHAAALLGLLRFVPDDQVHDVLQQLRAGRDAGNIVDSLRGQFHSADEIPFPNLLQAAPPPGQTSLEFELMVRHAAAYSPWAPTELPRLDFDSALKSAPGISIESPSSGLSPISTDTPSPLPPTESEASSSSGRPRFMTANSRDGSAGHSFSFSPQGKPGKREAGVASPPPLCDERLLNADILAWTSVKIPSPAARRIVSLYLETDHAITALFDVDLFLNDLISGGSRFCSRLLVSSLLSWACQAYRSYDLEATAWSYSFYDEAEQLLEQETALGMSTPNTVAAMIYLSMSATCHAKSTTAATEHLDHAIDLAKSIGLFGIADEGMSERWPDGATDFLWEKSLTQTAWGSFVYITSPIPGDAADFEDGKSPDGPHFPAYMGTTFPYLCKLALIAHDMIWVNYGNILRVEGYSMIEHMEVLYGRYLEWADRLPLELVRGGESAHHVLIMHIYFHAFVLDLFRPLVHHGDAIRARLESFTSQQASPEAICLASATQLGRIVVTYLQRFSSASHSFPWSTALLYFANAVMRELGRAADTSEKLADLRTCIFGYQRLQRSFRLSYGIIRSLLSMALREGAVGSSEARAIINDTDERAKHHRGHGEIQAPFIVDLDLGTLDPAAAHVDRLAAEFEELAIFNEFTVIVSGRETTNTSTEAMGSDTEGQYSGNTGGEVGRGE
ncbi:Zn 2cys6 transcription factor [Colletotrichum higginsianum IMI 349063]|uniref:Zn 2cys6 transcription factor n=1 Tax=Colletotrichum higginsianum (strain IMI 349063) TaxID=759273 RepID=A0A1B7YWY0_COLHI|nr:Zn 2cys6 transcription factor [Colletotrichum higginsianum IMI 349063]OBR16560.1 Zn 2cys6 transcription factor [Colletotrichum higginsianum IMI 349063]